MIALEISSRNSRVAALQTRWNAMRARLDLLLDERGADKADLPGSGLPVRGYKGKEADRLVTRIGLRSGLAGRRPARPRAAGRRGTQQWKTHHKEHKVIDASQAAITCRKPSTPARHGERTQVFPADAAAPTGDRGWMA